MLDNQLSWPVSILSSLKLPFERGQVDAPFRIYDATDAPFTASIQRQLIVIPAVNYNLSALRGNFSFYGTNSAFASLFFMNFLI